MKPFQKTFAAAALALSGSFAQAVDMPNPAPFMTFDPAVCKEPVQDRSFLEFMSTILQISNMVEDSAFDMKFVFAGGDHVPRAVSLIEINRMNPRTAASLLMNARISYFAMKSSEQSVTEDSFWMASPDKMCGIGKQEYERVKTLAIAMPKPE